MQNWSQMPQRPPLWTSSMARTVKNLPAMQETQVWFLGQEDPLEKGMAIHSSILAWRVPWTEEPDGLQSMGLQRVGHDWVTNASTFFLCSLYNSSKTVRTGWELLPEVKVTFSHPTPPPGGEKYSVKNIHGRKDNFFLSTRIPLNKQFY